MDPQQRKFLLCRAFGWSEPDYLDATVRFGDYALASVLLEIRNAQSNA